MCETRHKCVTNLMLYWAPDENSKENVLVKYMNSVSIVSNTTVKLS